MRGKHTTPPEGATHSSAGSWAIQLVTISRWASICVRMWGRSSWRRRITWNATSSSIIELQMTICSLAARRVVRSSASVVIAQPMRMPGMP